MKPTVLVFGGHDPTGGAGIQADIETIGVLGGHAATVITALTAQDSHSVKAIEPTPLDMFIQQARLLLDDMPVQAIKIGMVGSIEICEAIHTLLTEHTDIPVVLDPVMAGGGGGDLSTDGVAEAISTLLIPLATIATPNRKELMQLAPDGDTLQASGAELISMGCEHLLITGTDDPAADEKPGNVYHLLMNRNGIKEHFQYPRLPDNYHGSGCTLASAIAVDIAMGNSIDDAVARGLGFTWRSLDNSFHPGSGQHFPNRFFGK